MSDNAEWWENELRNRLNGYPAPKGSIAVSIKVRPVDGSCFDCGGCAPHVYKRLDELFAKHSDIEGYNLERHESGPEVIEYIKLGTAVAGGLLTVSAAVVSLVAAFINLRAAGQKIGDKKRQPIELIVRGFDLNGKIFDEKVLRLDPEDVTTAVIVKKAIETGVNRHLMTPPPVKAGKKTVAKKATTKTAAKRKR
jgi:hypothetical protein